ncbi:hypothetical protein ACFPT5_01940 [Ornithinimicrobium kibberense]
MPRPSARRPRPPPRGPPARRARPRGARTSYPPPPGRPPGRAGTGRPASSRSPWLARRRRRRRAPRGR